MESISYRGDIMILISGYVCETKASVPRKDSSVAYVQCVDCRMEEHCLRIAVSFATVGAAETHGSVDSCTPRNSMV